MIRAFSSVFALAFLVACAPAGAPAPQTPAQPQPIAELAAAFPNCQWGEVSAAGVSIWSYACPEDRLVADEALPGFQRETGAAGAATRFAAVRIFSKAADAPIEAVLAAVRAASPGAEACELTPGEHGRFVLLPTGEALAAYERFTHGQADGPSLPCGPLGPSEAGERTFQILAGAPDKVVMINWGSDLPIFDAQTLRATH